MFIVYVLKSEAAQKSYVGVTNNLERRLKEHNSRKHFYTKRYVPWIVLYQEEFKTFEDARTREKYMKSANGRKFLKKIFIS